MTNDIVIHKAFDYVRKLFSDDFSGHDFFHTQRVYNTACMIAEKEHAHLFTVQLAALLHDVDDIKLSPATHENLDNAVSFMQATGINTDTITDVCTIIRQISFVGTDSVIPDTLEGKCVQDADRLDAIGAIGIGRTFAFGGSHHRPMHDPASVPNTHMTAEQYRASHSTTIDHFYEKLLLLSGMMNTQTAKEMAAERDRFMRIFLDEFFCEWDGLR